MVTPFPRAMRYTRAARRATLAFNRSALGDPDLIARHHGDQFDVDDVSDGKLCVAPVREYVPLIPQTWDDTETAFKEPSNPVNQMGPLLEGCIPVVTANDRDSFVAALDKRANKQPDPKDDIEARIVANGIRLIKRWGYQHDLYTADETRWDLWMAKFTPEKQRRMINALATLPEVENQPGYLHEKQLSVKVEALLKRYDPTWAPRLIYASTDAFNALTGPSVNDMMGRLDNLCTNHVFCKVSIRLCYKRQDVELAEFLDDAAFPYCFEGDFSSNDLLQRRSMAKVVDAMYERLGAPKDLRRLFKSGVKYKIKNRQYGFKGFADGPFATGTTQTTFRNCVVNIVIFVSFINHKFGRLPHKVICKICVLGDDILVVCRLWFDVREWERWAASWKMKLKALHPNLAGEATLLSRRLCIQSDTVCMMPKLGKALARFNVRATKNASVSDSAYMAGKALSYAYEFRHFPMFRDLFLQRYKMEDHDNVVLDDISWFTRNSGVDLSKLVESIYAEKVLVSEDSTREFLMDAYGYTFGLCDAMDIARKVVCSNARIFVSWPQELAVDM